MENLDWKKYWQSYRQTAVNSDDDLYFQVGRTMNQKPVSKEMFEKMFSNIVTSLTLKNDDILLEMCCGNGLMTKPLSYTCKKIYAFDFTPQMIEIAIEHSAADNIIYKEGDVKELFLDLFTFDSKPNKILMCFSLGYFTPDDLTKILAYLSDNLTTYSFYITEIPCDDLKWNFYNTPERKQNYLDAIEKGDFSNGGLGRWWSYAEFEAIASSLDLKCSIQKQSELYNSKMNVLVQKM